jgi:hypothetical protein
MLRMFVHLVKLILAKKKTLHRLMWSVVNYSHRCTFSICSYCTTQSTSLLGKQTPHCHLASEDCKMQMKINGKFSSVLRHFHRRNIRPVSTFNLFFTSDESLDATKLNGLCKFTLFSLKIENVAEFPSSHINFNVIKLVSHHN